MGSGSVLRVLLLSVLACAPLLKAENPDEDGAPPGPRVAPVLQSKDGMWKVDFSGHDANVIPQPQVVSSGGIQMVAFLSQPQRENHNAIVFGQNPGAPLKLPKPWQSLLTQKSQTSDPESWQNSGSSRYRHWGPQPLSYSGGEQVREENSAQQPSQSSESQEGTHPQQPPSDNQELPFKYQTWGSITPTYQSGQVKYLNVGLLPSKPSSTNKQNLAVNPDQEQLDNLDLAIKYKPWGSDQPTIHSGQNVQLQPTSYSSGHELNPQLVSASSSQTSSILKPGLPVTPEQPLVNQSSIRYQAWGFQQPGYTSLHQLKPQNIGPHPSSGGLKVNVGETPSHSSVSNIRYQSWRLPNYISVHDKFKPTKVEPQLLSYQSGHQVRPQYLSLSSSQASSTDTPSLPVTPEPPLSHVASSVKYQAWESKQASYPSGHQFKPQSIGPQPSSGWLYGRHQNVGEQTSQPSSSKQHSSNNAESNLKFQAWGSWKPSYSSGQHQFKPQEAQSVSNPRKLLVSQQNSGQLPCLSSKPQDPENSKQQISNVVSPFGYVGQQQPSLPSGQVRQENSGQKPSQHSGSPNRLPVSPEQPLSNIGHIVWGTWQPNVQSGKQLKPQITGPQPSNNWLQIMHQNVGEQPSQPSSPQEQNRPVISEQSGSNLKYQTWGSWQPSYSSGQHQFKPQEAQSVSNPSKLLVSQQNSGQLPSLSSKTQGPENSKQQTSNVVSPFEYVGQQQPSLPSGQQVKQENSGQKPSQYSGSPNRLPVSPEQPPSNIGHIVWGTWQPNVQSGKQFKPQITGPQPSNNWLQVMHQNVGEQPSQPSSPQEQNLVTSEQSGSNLGYQTWGSWQPGYSSGQYHFKPQEAQSVSNPSKLPLRQQNSGQLPSLSSKLQDPQIPENSKQTSNVVSPLEYVGLQQLSLPSGQVKQENSGQKPSQHSGSPNTLLVSPQQPPSNIGNIVWGSWQPNIQSGKQLKPQITGPQPSNNWLQVMHQNVGEQPSQPSSPQEQNLPVTSVQSGSNLGYQTWGSWQPSYSSGQHHIQKPNFGQQPNLPSGSQEPGQQPSQNPEVPSVYQGWYSTGQQVRYQNVGQPSSSSTAQEVSFAVTPEQQPSNNVVSNLRYQTWGSQGPSFQSGQHKGLPLNLSGQPPFKPQGPQSASNPSRQVRPENWDHLPSQPSRPQEPNIPQSPDQQTSKNVSNIRYHTSRPKLLNYPSVQPQFKPPNVGSKPSSYPSGHQVRPQHLSLSSLASSTQKPSLPVTPEQLLSNNLDSSVRYQAWGSNQPIYQSGQQSKPQQPNLQEIPDQKLSVRYQSWWTSSPGRHQIQLQNSGQQPNLPSGSQKPDQPLSQIPGYKGWDSNKLSYPSGTHPVKYQNIGQPSRLSRAQEVNLPVTSEQQPSNLKYQTWSSQQPGFLSGQNQVLFFSSSGLQQYKPQGPQSASNPSRPQVNPQNLGQSPSQLSRPLEPHIPENPEQAPSNHAESRLRYQAWWSRQPSFPGKPQIGQQTPKPSLKVTDEQPPSSNSELSVGNQGLGSQQLNFQSGHQLRPQNVGEQPSQPSKSQKTHIPGNPEQQTSHNVVSNIRYQVWGTRQPNYPSRPYQLKPQEQQSASSASRPQVRWQSSGHLPNVPSQPQESNIAVAPEYQPFNNVGSTIGYEAWRPKLPNYPSEQHQFKPLKVGPQPSSHSGGHQLSLSSSLASSTQKPSLPETPEQPLVNLESSKRNQVWWSIYQSGHRFKPQIIGPQSSGWLQVRHQNVSAQTSQPSITLEENLPVAPKQPLSNNAQFNIRYQTWGSQVKHQNQGVPHGLLSKPKESSIQVTPEQPPSQASTLLPRYQGWGSNQEVSVSKPSIIGWLRGDNHRFQVWGSQQPSYQSGHTFKPQIIGPQSSRWLNVKHQSVGEQTNPSSSTLERLPVTPEPQPSNAETNLRYQVLGSQQPSYLSRPHLPSLHSRTGEPSLQEPLRQHSTLVTPQISAQHYRLPSRLFPQNSHFMTGPHPVQTPNPQNPVAQLQQGQQSHYRKPKQPSYPSVWHEQGGSAHLSSPPRPEQQGYVSKPLSQSYPKITVPPLGMDYVVSGKVFSRNQPQQSHNVGISQSLHTSQASDSQNQPKVPLPKPAQQFQNTGVLPSRPKPSFPLPQVQNKPVSPKPPYMSQNPTVGYFPRPQASYIDQQLYHNQPPSPTLPEEKTGVLSKPQTSFVHPQLSFQVHEQSQEKLLRPSQESHSPEVVRTRVSYLFGQNKPPPPRQPQAGYSDSQLSVQAPQQSNPLPRPSQESQSPEAVHSQASYLLVQKQPAPLPRPSQHSQNSGVLLSRLQTNTGSRFNYPRPPQPLRQNSGILPSTPQKSFVLPQFSFQVYQQSQNNPHTTPYQESQSSEVVQPQANYQLGQKKPSVSFPRPSQQSQTPVLQPQAGYSGSQLTFQARQQSQNNPSNPQESQITGAAHPQASYLLVQSQPHTGYLSSQLSQSLPAAPLSRLQQSQNSVFPKPLPSYPQNNLDRSPPSWAQSQSPSDALSPKPQVLSYHQSQQYSKPVISPKPQQPQVSLDGFLEQSQNNPEPSWLAQNPAVVFSGPPARYSHPQQSQNQPDGTNEVLSGKPQIYQLGTKLFHWPGSIRPPQQSQNQPADTLSKLQQSPRPEEPKAQASKTDLEQNVPFAKPQPSRSSRILVSSPSGYPKPSQNQGGVPLRKPQLRHPASWQYHNSALLSRPYQSQRSRTLDPRWQPNYPLPQRSQNQHGGTLPRPTQWSQNQAIPFQRPNPGYPQHSLNSPKRPKLVPSHNYAGVSLPRPPQLTSYTRRQPSYPQASQPSFSYTSPQHASTGSKWFWYHPGFYPKPQIYKVPKTQSSQNSPGVLLSRSQQASRRSQSPPVNNPNVFSSRPYQSYPGPLSLHNKPEVKLQWPQTSNAGSEQPQNLNSGVGSQSRKPNVYHSWD